MPAETPLDRIDFALLALLQKDGRMSNKELAAAVGLAPSSCHQRVRRLWERGVLRGVHADVDPAAVGISLQALIAVRLKLHSRETFDAFGAFVRALPETVAVYRVAGADDFLLHVAVRDAAHLQDITADQLASRPEVERMNTSLLFSHERAGGLPLLGAADAE